MQDFTYLFPTFIKMGTPFKKYFKSSVIIIFYPGLQIIIIAQSSFFLIDCSVYLISVTVTYNPR